MDDRRWRCSAALVLTALALVLLVAQPALAHDEYEVGPLRLSIGWADEPAVSGLANAVEVTVTTEDGAPVADLGGGSLSAEVTFGTETTVVALAPAGRAGVFAGRLIPTRPGTYEFHITGVALEQAIDITTACSETTFDCVDDAGGAQFPTRDPSAGELAERLDREVARAEQAESSAASASRLAVGALGVGVVALVGVVLLGRRRSHPPAA